MNQINLGLIGYGTVGSGVVQLLKKRARLIKNRFNTCYAVKAVCDLNIKNMQPKGLKKALTRPLYS